MPLTMKVDRQPEKPSTTPASKNDPAAPSA